MVKAGLLGVVLGLLVLLFGGVVLFFADRLTGGSGLGGLAASSTAGNAAVVPIWVAAANPIYQHAARPATVLVSASVVVTAIGTPLVVAWYAKRLAAKESAPAELVSAAR